MKDQKTKIRWIVIYDRYGYSQWADARGSHSEREDKIIAAGLMNYWWKVGGLDNLPSGYEVVTDPDRVKAIEINDCAIAWSNGLDHCQ